MQVFISYKREDVDFAKRLYSLIEASDFTPWLDVMNLRPGDDWDSAIHQGMKDAQIVIGVLTTESLGSNNVLDEWGYALSTGKRLFLLWLREVDEADIPPRYIRIQRIDMRRDESIGMERLRTALLSAAKITPQPTRIPAAKQNSAKSTSIDSMKIVPVLAKGQPEVAQTVAKIEPPRPQSQQLTNRKRMLEKIKLFWVQGVLEQSLYGAALIELGLKPHVNAVDSPWDTVLKHTIYGDYRLPTGTKISDIYHDLDNELLILGDPGSGKTTTLLELTRDRILLAEQDDREPIPVILNLSSWADDRKPLVQWLVSELNTKYAVPRKVAAAWIESDALLLLLDGLDEVVLRYRDLCVQAINDFRSEHGFTPMVVCSRSADYEALSTRLHLNGAIVLEPLSEEQIDDYLRSLGSEMQGVREAMITDPDLHKLAESPLMLSIMTLAFRGLHSEDLPPLQSIEAQRRRLFETYTRRMFDRRPLLQGTPDHFRHYLNWLAGRMVERKQSVFYIENLQSDWIAGDRLRRLYRIVGRSVFGAIGGAAIGALSGLALVLVFALTGNIYFQTLSLNNLIAGAFAFIAFPAGLGALVFAISGLQAFALDSISEELHSFQQILRRIFEVITVGAILGLVAAILAGIGLLILALLLDALRPEYMQYNLSQNLDPLTGWAAIGVEATIVIGIALGLGAFAGTLSAAVAIAVNLIQPQRRVQLGVMTLGFYGGLLGLSISVIIALLWVIFSSTDTSLGRLPEFILSSAITGGILALTVCILPKRWAVTPYVLLSLVPFGMVIGLAISLGLGLLMGGSDVVVKHAVLRFFLRRSDNIPRNYAALLDDATDRVLLRKVGGGYIFIHRYLLEYYASLEGQSDNPPSTS